MTITILIRLGPRRATAVRIRKKWEAEQGIDRTHQDLIDLASEVSRNRTDNDADSQRHSHGDESHGQRDRGTMEHPREDIASQIVCA